LKEQLTD
jgi:hypothetical protein